MHLGQVFVLKHDVFIWDDNARRPWFDPASINLRLRLVPPGGGSTLDGDGIRDLPTLDQYSRSREPMNIRGIIHKGTVFSLDGIECVNGIDVEPVFYQFKVIDGDGHGKRFCLTDLMLKTPLNQSRIPDPLYLQSIP